MVTPDVEVVGERPPVLGNDVRTRDEPTALVVPIRFSVAYPIAKPFTVGFAGSGPVPMTATVYSLIR
jgi:hypothetical protein